MHRIAYTVLCSTFVLLCALQMSLAKAADDAAGARTRALRVGIQGRDGPDGHLAPLFYGGGWNNKTAIYEGLVRLDERGRLVPGLASSWNVSPDLREVTLELREGVRFHDGKPLDAVAVRDHMCRWRDQPADRWVGSVTRIERLDVVDPRHLRVVLTEPWALLSDLASSINPMYVVGPGAFDYEDNFLHPVGTGPYAWVAQMDNQAWSLRANPSWWGGKPGVPDVELLAMAQEAWDSRALVDLLRRGEVDLIVDSNRRQFPREYLSTMAADARFRVWSGPGSPVTFAILNAHRGVFHDRELRRACAAQIDRSRHVREGESGWAIEATTLYTPGFGGWPTEGHPPPPAPRPVGQSHRAVLLLDRAVWPRIQRHANLLAEAFALAGVALEIEEPKNSADYARRRVEGEFDVILVTTHGVPYDPTTHMQSIFMPRPAGQTAIPVPPVWKDERLPALVGAAMTTYDETSRAKVYAEMQAVIDEEAVILPLFRSHAVAVGASWIDGVEVGLNNYDARLHTLRLSQEPPERVSLTR